MKSAKRNRKGVDSEFSELASEEKIISEEYKLWKRNVPFMYDSLSVRATEFAAPTVEWLPPIEDDSNSEDLILQRILHGGHGTEQFPDTFIFISSIFLAPIKDYQQGEWYETKVDEYGEFQFYLDKFNPILKIPHNGNVYSVRHLPQNEDIIVSRNLHDLYVFDLEMASDPIQQDDDDETSDSKNGQPDRSLKDCEPMFEATSVDVRTDLKWHRQDEGVLLTGFHRNKVAIWNIEQQNARRKKKLATRPLEAKTVYEGHTGVVNDVAWHCLHPTIFGSCSEEGEIALWDIRSRNTSKPSHMIKGHEFGVQSIAFNPFSEYLFATSSLDRSIALWDLRNLSVKLHSIHVKKDTFFKIQWSPHFRNLFASCNNDRRLHIFDIDRILTEQTVDEAELGDSSLIFSHGGHTSRIFDFDWNPSRELSIVSSSDDNIIQTWQMSSKYLEQKTK